MNVIGTAAAGCEANGFWFELQESVRSSTSEMLCLQE
jgi:hypothetical protein